MKIWLIRHGITDWNVSSRSQGLEDIELNEGGRKQAEYCAGILSELRINHIATSPLKRASETAQFIADRQEHADVEKMNEFIERDFGLLSGKFPEEAKRLRSEEIAGRIDLKVEQRDAVFHRAMTGILALSRRYPNDDVVVVTHGGVISALLRRLSKEWVPGTFLNNVYITELVQKNGEFQVTAMNISPEDFVKTRRKVSEKAL